MSTSKAKWGGKGKEREDESQEKGLKGGRVVVFVVGGCSYSELRGVYELTDSYQREVILGLCEFTYNFGWGLFISGESFRG